MNYAEALKYYATMRDEALERVLTKPLVADECKKAIRALLKEREEKRERTRKEQLRYEKEKPRSKNSRRSMFGENVRIHKKRGRIRQGGAVNPR